MAFFGLAAYDEDLSSSDDDADNSDDDAGVGNNATVATTAPTPPKIALPSPDDAFGQVKGPPKFLLPEATKPIARNAAHALLPPRREVAYVQDPEGVGGKRRVAESAVISAAPKRYKEDELRAGEKTLEAGGAAGAGGDALAMAMLGVPAPRRKVLGGKSTFVAPPARPMAVSEFLAKGPGGALLPRKLGKQGQDRMDQEKKKRGAGQNGRDSTEWKSEAEMAMRQQYDC